MVVDTTVFLFPGQGSQFSGMGKDLFDAHKSVRELFDLAGTACERDMKTLLFESSEDVLKQTENAQPAIVLASLAARRVLMESGIQSSGSAGHSLGEYCALVDAGILSEEDALRSVNARGAYMASAGDDITAQKGPIGMAAVLGIGPEETKKALSGLNDVFSANENSPVQVVIGGTLAGMKSAEDPLKSLGAKRIIPLKVTCPFHTPLMSASADSMKDFLSGVTFSEPQKTVWSSVSAGMIQSGEEARELLVQQITQPVRWVDTMETIGKFLNNESLFLYEVGPGTVLKGLWDKSRQKGKVNNAGTLDQISNLVQDINKE